jgi:hypothetical protein
VVVDRQRPQARYAGVVPRARGGRADVRERLGRAAAGRLSRGKFAKCACSTVSRRRPCFAGAPAGNKSAHSPGRGGRSVGPGAARAARDSVGPERAMAQHELARLGSPSTECDPGRADASHVQSGDTRSAGTQTSRVPSRRDGERFELPLVQPLAIHLCPYSSKLSPMSSSRSSDRSATRPFGYLSATRVSTVLQTRGTCAARDRSSDWAESPDIED